MSITARGAAFSSVAIKTGAISKSGTALLALDLLGRLDLQVCHQRARLGRNPNGSTAARTSKCKCVDDDIPLFPIAPMSCWLRKRNRQPSR